MADRLAHEAGDGTTRALAELPADAWTVLRGVVVPARRGSVRVDHLVVGPPGVFTVVTGKPGRVDVRARDVAAARAAAAATAELTGVVPSHGVYAVLSLDTEAPIDTWLGGVIVCSPTTILELLSARRPTLAPHEVRDAALELDAVSEQPAQRRPGRGASHRLDTRRRRRRTEPA